MKKTTRKIKAVEKSIFRSAGEVVGSIGHGIAEGKDKLVDAAKTVMETFSTEKTAVVKKVKKAVKKAAPKKSAIKKSAVKKSARKTVKKATGKVKKIAKKVARKVSRKATSKK